MDSIFSEANEVKSAWVSWGAVGDWIKGTLTDIREIESQLPGKIGEKVKVYEFKAHSGEFHRLDENKQVIPEPIILQPGEFWSVSGKPGIDQGMRNVKIGNIVGMRFTEEKAAKTKGYNKSKLIKVYDAGRDSEYMGETSNDIEQ